MSNYINLLERLRPAPNTGPDIGQLFMQGYQQGQQMRRQAEQDRIAAEDRKRARQDDTLAAGLKQIQLLRSIGQNEAAAKLYNDQLRPLMEQRHGFAPPPLVGAPVTDQAAVANRQMAAGLMASPLTALGIATQPEAMGGALDALAAPTTKRSFDTTPTTRFLDRLSGYQPPTPKYEQWNPANDLGYIDPNTGRPVIVRQGQSKPQATQRDRFTTSTDAAGNVWRLNLDTGETVNLGPMGKPQVDASGRPRKLTVTEAKALLGPEPSARDFGILSASETDARIKMLALEDTTNNPGGMAMGPRYQKALAAARQRVADEQKQAKAAFTKARQEYAASLRQLMGGDGAQPAGGGGQPTSGNSIDAVMSKFSSFLDRVEGQLGNP